MHAMSRLFIFYVVAMLSACGEHQNDGHAGANVNTAVVSTLRLLSMLPTQSISTTNRSSVIGNSSNRGNANSSAPVLAEKATARSTLTKPVTLTVLHIEDNPESLRTMRRMFGSLPNLTLLDAHTGEFGIKLATANPPALIMVDMTLPGIEGAEVARRLRNNPVTRDIPVIAITANSRALGFELNLTGFDDYLAKPIDAARLQVVLNRRLLDLNKRAQDSTTVVKQ